jgi:DNA-binding protein HU-beta
MNKAELIDLVASKAELSKAEVGRVLDTIIDVIGGSLAKKDPVVLVGFGTFDVTKTKQRTGRNPRTGEAITIAAKVAPKFRAGKALKDRVNKK